MKYYKCKADHNSYIYVTKNPNEECIEYKEHDLISKTTWGWSNIFVRHFLGDTYEEITEQQFNSILLEKGMGDFVVTTSLKSKIIRAF